MFKNQYPFDLLTDNEFIKITEGAVIRELKANEFIIHEEDNEETVELHFLISGLAKNILHRANGKQVSIRFYYPGDLIGMMIMLTSGEMRFSVQALENTKTICLNKANFMEVMTNNTNFSKVVLDGISNLMKSLYQEVKYKSSDTGDQNEKELYRKRVDTFMELPVFIQPSKSIEDAAKLLQHKKMEGLIVSEDQSKMVGMIGYSEILNAVMKNDLKSSVSNYMQEDIYSVADQDFIYEALSYLKHHPTVIIPVFHKSNVVGFLRQSSFFNIKDSVYFDTSYRISKSKTVNELKSLSPTYNKEFQQFIKQLIDEGTFGYEICELISSLNDRIHKQVIRIAEEEMVREGYGPPQINYCFIVMGSEGRKEQGFSTDQDNGLILSDYKHFKDATKIDLYFEKLSEKINFMLEECGFPLCTGGIMAKENKWRKPYSQWSADLKEWIVKIDAEEIRDFTIFTDFRPIYGDFSLAYSLRDELTNKIKNSLNLHQLLMKDTLRFRVPIQPFGRIIGSGKKRSLNLKKSAIMQIVNAVRIYSAKNGIEDANTINRLDQLANDERFHPRDAENAKMALHRLLTFRLSQNLIQLENQEPLTNEIIIQKLSKEEKRKLKEALSIARRLQQVIELSYNRNRVV
ncbi:cyclic nucleotide-binding domain-containing protein [Aquibacillus halophilus]|uniref:Cyclic nucleotide-binding domain-containing protein n=2 Tax=Aquibacillus halophilus TaxID=930132 RepID=A0A6A8DBW5_9BACI|nr:DUF294 nucleotidyltransferase-like domain-containing protein [Aquibacillus halophilus]MRH43183.1 cyclic nucleotide-binding domain-containing protein [Aquibacillus halophilus]